MFFKIHSLMSSLSIIQNVLSQVSFTVLFFTIALTNFFTQDKAILFFNLKIIYFGKISLNFNYLNTKLTGYVSKPTYY